jgi:hypothetical protein
MVPTQSGLFHRTRCGPYGAHSLWVAKASFFHSQKKMRTLWCTIILGWRNLSFALPEREANPMVHAHAELRNLGLQSQNEMRTLWCTRILGCRNLSFAFRERDANTIRRTHCGVRKSTVCMPRTRCEPSRAHSIWVGETKVFERDADTMVHTHSGFAKFKFGDANPIVRTHAGLAKPNVAPRTRCEPMAAPRRPAERQSELRTRLGTAGGDPHTSPEGIP